MSSTVFQNHREIHEWLWHNCHSFLDESKRAAVEVELSALLDGGAVTEAEVAYTLLPRLRQLRDQRTLTAFEYDKLAAALGARER